MEKGFYRFLSPLFLTDLPLAGQQHTPSPSQQWDNNGEMILLFTGIFFLLMIIAYIAALIRERKRYKFLLQNMEEHILIINPEGEIQETVTGDLNIRSLHNLFELEEWAELSAIIEKSREAPPGRIYRLILKSSRYHKTRYYRIIVQNMNHRSEIKGIIVTLLDITETKTMEQELLTSREIAYHQARHDMLTEIPNRLYFYEMVSRNFQRLKRNPRQAMCLLMLDLDHFKKVNDKWGHDIGDIVLKELTRICIKEIRGSDIFARFGGEEFIAFLDETDITEGYHIAERIRRVIESHMNWPEKLSLTVSIGVAGFQDETCLDDLIKKADIALYRAKSMGRNTVCRYTGDQKDPEVSQS